jgi:hypothetical protein
MGALGVWAEIAVKSDRKIARGNIFFILHITFVQLKYEKKSVKRKSVTNNPL